MTTRTIIDASEIEPLDHEAAMRLQETELARAIALLTDLGAEEWTIQTACPDWDVRQMWLHVLGACEASASIRENVHQLRRAWLLRRSAGLPLEAGLSTTQVAERADLAPSELVARLADVAPRAVRGRARLPKPVRMVKLAVDAPVVERWSLGYLNDTIYLRDLWMHRVDTGDATGRPLQLTADHDGRIVADVVGEWARRHGHPFQLELTGPAGGSFRCGHGGESLTVDAVAFCRLLSGRGEPTGLLATVVPF